VQLQQITAHAERFVWEKYREEKELDEAFGEAKRIQGALKEHEKDFGERNQKTHT
jgi:DNA repair protein SbcC/Rad50